eukprot:Ihof_evm1s273 gene=Ihof_evmTU1s273
MTAENYSFDQFLAAHEPILQASNLPEALWKDVYTQVNTQTFSAGEYVEFSHFDITTEGTDDEIQPPAVSGLSLAVTSDMKKEETVFVVDHAFTFRTKEEAVETIEQVPALRTRIQHLISEQCQEEDALALLQLALPLIHMYMIASPDPEAAPVPIFYMLDEVGSRIRRTLDTDHVNTQLGLFVCMFDGLGYSLVWPTKDIAEGSTLYCTDMGDQENIRMLLGLDGDAPVQPITKASEETTIGSASTTAGAKVQVGLIAINERPGMGSVMKCPEVDIAQHVHELSGLQVEFDYIRLDDFPIGVSDEPELALTTAKALAERNKTLLVMAVGDMLEGQGFLTRLQRCRDVLCVLKAISEHYASTCTLYPCYSVLEFAYYKTVYMKCLKDNGVNTVPTILATATEFKELGAKALAEKKTIEFLNEKERHFGLKPETRLDYSTIYVKSDSQWCREGNVLLKFNDDIAESMPTQLEKTFTHVLGEYRSSGVQIQPCTVALTGRNPEFKGYFLDGELCVVLKAYFKTGSFQPGQETLVHSEIMLTDIGVPKDDDIHSEVPFSQLRKVMNDTHRALMEHTGSHLIFARIDCAVDSVSGEVMLLEVEAGLDSGTFPYT